jgi:hypothetical protein
MSFPIRSISQRLAQTGGLFSLLLVILLVLSCCGPFEQPRSLTSIVITGPLSIYAQQSANYACTGYFNDGSSVPVASEATWEVDCTCATISDNGLLSVGPLSGDTTCRVSASYQYWGETKSDSVSVLCQAPEPAGSITVTVPNGGEIWRASDSEPIQWTSHDAGSSVMLEYSTDGGSSWTVIASSTPNDGIYFWLVPGDPSHSCRVRVSSTTFPSVSDSSNENFEIRGIADVTVESSPNPVTIDVGSNELVTYAFTNGTACAVTFTQIVAAFFTPAGIRLSNNVTMSHELQIPGLGTTSWVDYTYLPPDVVSAAESAGAASVVLHETFVGTACTGEPVQVTDELTINW